MFKMPEGVCVLWEWFSRCGTGVIAGMWDLLKSWFSPGLNLIETFSFSLGLDLM